MQLFVFFFFFFAGVCNVKRMSGYTRALFFVFAYLLCGCFGALMLRHQPCRIFDNIHFSVNFLGAHSVYSCFKLFMIALQGNYNKLQR